MPNDFPDWSTPATYLSNFLTNQVVSPSLQIGPLDISLYQSVQLNLLSLSGSASLSIVWYDSFGNQLDIESLTVLAGQSYNVVLPCIGTRLVIQNNFTGTLINVSVEGSTRSCDNLSFPGSNTSPWDGGYSGAVSIGTPVVLNPITGSPTFTTYNGEVQFDVLSTVSTGLLVARAYNPSLLNVDQVVAVVSPTSVHIIGRYIHPAQPVQWIFYPTSAGPTAVALLMSGSG